VERGCIRQYRNANVIIITRLMHRSAA